MGPSTMGCNELHDALERKAGAAEVLALLVARPAGAAEKDKRSNLPLHFALSNKAAPEVVSALLAAHLAGAALKGQTGSLPLHLALQYKAAPEVVLALMAAHPAGAMETDVHRSLALHLALTNKAAPEVVSALFAAHPTGAAVKGTDGNLPLHLALANKASLDVVLTLFAAHPAGAVEKIKNGNLPLHLALANEFAPKVASALLAAHPAGAAEKGKDNSLPLHFAAANKAAPAVVSALLTAHPAGAAEKDADGYLPLHLALFDEVAPEVVSALLAAHPGGLVEKTKAGNLALHIATANKASSVVVSAVLAARPAGAAEKDKSGNLPLHLALANKVTPKVVSELLAAHTAGATKKDKKGRLPLHLAAQFKASPKVVSALLAAHPAGAAEKDNDGNLPIHLAATNKASLDVVLALFAAHPAGAAVKAKDGRSALQCITDVYPADEVSHFVAAVAHLGWCAWHEVVKVEAFAPVVMQIVTADPSLADLADDVGNSALDVAIGACRRAMVAATAFLGRYTVEKTVHTSATCTVLLARDQQAPAGADTIVALKLMRDEEAFLSEVLPRVRYDFGEQYVVGVLRVHVSVPAALAAGRNICVGNADGPSSSVGGGGSGPIGDSPHVAAAAAAAAAATAHVEALLASCAGVEGHIHKSGAFGSTGIVKGRKPHTLCVVMPRGERSLLDALLHEHFAGNDWLMVRAIFRNVVQALSHMHSMGMVHGDIKPLNVMAFGTNWRLIDLDVAREIGMLYGDKAPSSGYCAPEVAAAMLAAISSASVSDGPGSERSFDLRWMWGALKGMKASVAADLWSAGVLLYFMGAACQLLQTDLNDDLEPEDLRKLAAWRPRDLNSKLVARKLTKTNAVLADLLTKLLDPNPVARLAHWGVCAGDSEGMACDRVLEHPFFKDNTEMLDMHLQMDAIHNALLGVGSAVHGVGAKVDVVDAKMDVMLQRMQAQTRMMSCMLTGDRAVPGLLFFVPGGAGAKGRGWWNAAMRPSEWLQQEVRVYFVCAVSMEWDEASGFPLKFTREWVSDAMPYIKVSLTILKIAAAAGRLAGFPIPDFVGNIGQMLDQQLGVLNTLTEGLGEAAAAGLKAVEAVTRAAWDGAVAGADAPDLSAAQEPLRKSCGDVRRLLDTEHPDWVDQIALRRTVCEKDGLCEWVKPKYVEQFKLRGGEMLGAASTEQAPDPGAAQRAVKEVREAYEARLAAAEQQLLLARLEAGTGNGSQSGGAAAASHAVVVQAQQAQQPQQQQQAQPVEQERQPGGCGLLFGLGDRRLRSTRVAPTTQASPRR
ncbi:hypothetical protein FOA52_004054 [Chlamydomonas sp. UWO 241]|nr:hypothetical protein FOA52_004054 [Chlamydomonas sp. UWO 241]